MATQPTVTIEHEWDYLYEKENTKHPITVHKIRFSIKLGVMTLTNSG